jgi:uncharacterized protein YjbI with pentapeptide repeats
MLKITTIELRRQYAQGERDFEKIDLEGANLQELDLGGVNFTQANLKHANLVGCNLQEACLNKADLYGAKLFEADLDKASLIATNLEKANLTNASLNETKLIEAYSIDDVYFNRTFLIGAYLNGAYLKGADFRGAYLTSAFLNGAYLKGAKIAEANLSGSYYDERTIFDADFIPEDVGMMKSSNTASKPGIYVADLLDVINYISACSNRYLGNLLTRRFLKNSQPEFEELRDFKINLDGQVEYTGLSTISLNNKQVQFLQLWIESFVKNCSKIIPNFSNLIEKRTESLDLTILG